MNQVNEDTDLAGVTTESPSPALATCEDCYEISVIRNSNSPKLVNLCVRHAACNWVACGMDEAFPRRVSLTFATEDDAYAYYRALCTDD